MTQLPRPTLIGNAKTIFAMPCAIPQMLYIETFVPALMRAVQTIAIPDMKAAYHYAFGQSVQCSIKGQIMAENEGDPGLGQSGQKFLFKFAEYADRAVWWAFVFSVVEQGLMDWSTQLIKMAKCPDSFKPNTASSTEPYGAIFGDNDNNSCYEWINANPISVFGPAFAPGLEIPPGYTGLIFCSALSQDANGVPVPTTLNLRDQDNGDLIQTDTGTHWLPKGWGIVGGFSKSMIFQRFPNFGGTTRRIAMHAKSIAGLPTNQAFPTQGSCFLALYPGAHAP